METTPEGAQEGMATWQCSQDLCDRKHTVQDPRNPLRLAASLLLPPNYSLQLPEEKFWFGVSL